MVRVLALAALALAVSAKTFTRHFDVQDLIHSNTEGLEAAAPEEWFEAQKVDHFDATNAAVWKQRFFTNDEFYGGAGSPVFVYINGENVARNTTVGSQGLFMNVLAKNVAMWTDVCAVLPSLPGVSQATHSQPTK
ncbi:hypothetical protein As57867_005727, partial [Aphanomyces stellatus]